MLLTMSASVQNDSLALLLGAIVLILAFVLLDDSPRPRRGVALGGLAGLAVLTKLTDWVVVAGVTGWLVWVHGRRALTTVVAFLGATLAVSVGGSCATSLSTVTRPQRQRSHEPACRSTATGLLSPGDLGHIVQQIVTYLWLPTEYLRNLISAPTVLKAVLLVITVTAAALGAARLGSASRFGLLLVGGTAFLSLVTWLVTYLAYQSVAPRVAYLALPLWVCLLGLAASRLPSRMAVATVVVLVAALNTWTVRDCAAKRPQFISW